MTSLQQAAQDIIDRWDSPKWSDPRAMAEVVLTLRKALDAELQQSVEPFAYISKAGIALTPCETLPDDVPLYLHPPQQAKQVPMSADDIYQLAQRGAVNDGLTAIVREVEAHHGINGGQP